MSRMGETICFDTTPLIWGVRGYADRGDEHQAVWFHPPSTAPADPYPEE